jgi:hypothetical protein
VRLQGPSDEPSNRADDLGAHSAFHFEIVNAPYGDDRLVRLPDGSERFVVDEQTLMTWTSTLG